MLYAAHIREDKTEQSVQEHLEAAAKIARESAAPFGMGAFAELSALLHDMGKLCTDFNSYIHGDKRFSRGQIDHSYAGAKHITELAAKTEDKALYDTALLIARLIISHHGLHDWIEENGSDYAQSRLSKDERYNEIYSAFRAVIPDERIMTLLREAEKELRGIQLKIGKLSQYGDGKHKAQRIGFYMGMLERLMQSVLIDADRTDTVDFEAGSKKRLQYESSVLWDNMQQNIIEKLKHFEQRKDKISLCRRDISQRSADFAKHKVNVCRLIVPTGGGKTLSSLRFAADYCKRYDMERIIYTAPFMSILEQNSDVFREISGNDAMFLEHHSNFIADSDDGDEPDEHELHCEKWDNPLIATTLVQLLNTLFSGKSSCVRRMYRLCRSVIIIDEIQSIPLKCVHLFNLAVNFLTQLCGCTVVLCSATQPQFDNDDRYPMLLDEDFSMTGDYNADFETLRRTRLIDATRVSGYRYDEAALFCYEKFSENNNLLVIVNTKKAAEKLALLLKEMTSDTDTTLIHLSTKMCPEHRRDTIESMKKLLSENRPVICVTTQLIEAGVDISFRCVVRSLAGLDNAAQAAGRCNRNGENDCCDVYIINIIDEVLSHLREITLAQSASREILRQNENTDLLSVPVMTDYFRLLYKQRSDELSYPVFDLGETNLVDMLSLNPLRAAQKNLGILPFKQAFRTAGKLFKVIESETRSIIVPYDDEATRLILELNSDTVPEEAAILLKKAQKYAVGIYSSDERALNENNAVYPLKCGAFALKKEFYDSVFGVTLEAAKMELYDF